MRLVLLILAILAAGLAFLWWSQHRASAPAGWQGYAEADYVKVGPVLEGLLTSVSVARGDEVAHGAPLFTQDDTADLALRDQAARQLEEAQRSLANLEAAAKPPEIAEAEANLADARALVDKTQADLRRDEMLRPQGVVSQQTLDQARASQRSAVAREQAAEAALALARAPTGRERQIEAQREAVKAAQAALGYADWRLAQRNVTAPAAGRVADVIARPGEVVAAGSPVVSLLPPENIFVRFFVPEDEIAAEHRGDAVSLACDGCPAGLRATISFISPQAEYTPPVIYSEASRAKLVFLVEARPPADEARRLNPGQPMEVRPAAPDKAP